MALLILFVYNLLVDLRQYERLIRFGQLDEQLKAFH